MTLFPIGIWRTIASTVRAELNMRLHSQSLLMRLLFLLALCAALAPQPGASYAIIKIGNMIPVMSADTALVAAAVVINLLLVLGFALMLDVGRVRDTRLGVNTLFRTQPIAASLLAVGRLLANVLYGFGFAAIAAMALMTTFSVRYGEAPSLASLAIFLLLVAPAVIAAATVGALIDLALPDSPVIKTVTAVVVWVVILMADLSGSVDLVGTSAVHSLLGPGHFNDGLSLGLVPTGGTQAVAWRKLENVDTAFITARLFIGFALVIFALVATTLAAPLLHVEYRRSLRGAGALASSGLVKVIPASAERPTQLPSRQATGLNGLRVTGMRLYRQSPFAMFLLAASFAIGFAANVAPGIAISVVLAVPFLLLARTGPADIAVARTIERCEPALQFPTAALVNCLAMLSMMLLAVLPVFARMPVVQVLTAVCGMAVFSLWLTLTHRVLGKPLLGVSVAGLLLYILVFNHPPSAMDIVGLWSPSIAAFGVSAIMATVLTGILALQRP